MNRSKKSGGSSHISNKSIGKESRSISALLSKSKSKTYSKNGKSDKNDKNDKNEKYGFKTPTYSKGKVPRSKWIGIKKAGSSSVTKNVMSSGYDLRARLTSRKKIDRVVSNSKNRSVLNNDRSRSRIAKSVLNTSYRSIKMSKKGSKTGKDKNGSSTSKWMKNTFKWQKFLNGRDRAEDKRSLLSKNSTIKDDTPK